MKRIYKELQEIRRQMEEDYMLHAERGSAQQQSIERIDRHLVLIDSDLTVAKLAVGELQHNVGEMQSHLGDLQNTVGVLQNTVGELQNNVGVLQNTVGKLSDSLGGVRVSVGGLTHEFREFASLVRAENATWLFDRLEKRLNRLEDGAA